MAEDGQAAALKAKEAGNAAYKARDFQTAIGHYTQAWELHKDITYLNNLAGERTSTHTACFSQTGLTRGPLQRRSSRQASMTLP